jgi:hypothetical protein
MRRLLLWLACELVGLATVGDGLALLAPNRNQTAGPALLSWVLVLAIGVALSAPFFLNPPDISGDWWATLPILLWVFIMVLRMLWWIGFTVLRGAWYVIGTLRDMVTRLVNP